MTRVPALLLGLVLLLAGCSGTSASSPGTNEAALQSPLDSALGLFDAQDEESASFISQASEHEAAIAECMASSGFEYFPVETRFLAGNADQGSATYGPHTEAEWHAQFGYGITTTVVSQAVLPGSIVGIDYELPNIDEPNARNDEYVTSLSVEAKGAYDEAFYGNEPVIPDGATADETDTIYSSWSPDGCFYRGAQFLEALDPDVADLYELIEEMESRIEADGRIEAHRQEVRTCVEAKGFPYLASQPEARRHFVPMMQDIVAQLEALELDDAADLAPEVQVALTELQSLELTIASAVVECGGNPTGESAFERSVRFDHEAAFVEANGDRIALVLLERNARNE